MALKALMLRKKIDAKNKELEALRSKKAELEKRESELATAIEEAAAETATEEERSAVEAEVETFENEQRENAEAIESLETEVAELEEELTREEAAQDTTKKDPVVEPEERKANIMPEKRNRFGISEEMVTRENVKAFLTEIRASISEKRAIQQGGVLIPTEFLGLVRENVPEYSKLYKHVFLRQIGGEGKLAVMGTIPEAIWTACCANINEIDLGFAEVVVDCNKVAAVVPVCNTILEDNDVNLASQIVEALSIAIGKALDKAILYGSGAGMPLGVYTRLAQTSKPDTYPAKARTWVDLHTSNMLTIANTVTGTELFATIMTDSAAMSKKYSRGNAVWVMNETTYKFLKAQGMNVNAAGAIVSAVDGTMPGVGGVVELVEDVPNYNIIGGYFDCYLLAERMGITVETAEQTKFVEDETLFRGKARYDGQPVIAEAFINLAINSASAAAATFTADTANACAFIQLDKNAVTLATTTGTAQLKARLLNDKGQEVTGTITWASSASAKATVSDTGKITGVASGSAVITATCNGAVAVCNVTVPS